MMMRGESSGIARRLSTTTQRSTTHRTPPRRISSSFRKRGSKFQAHLVFKFSFLASAANQGCIRYKSWVRRKCTKEHFDLCTGYIATPAGDHSRMTHYPRPTGE